MTGTHFSSQAPNDKQERRATDVTPNPSCRNFRPNIFKEVSFRKNMAQLLHKDPSIVKSTSSATSLHFPNPSPPTPSTPKPIIPTPFPTPHTKPLANRHIRITTTTNPPSRQQPQYQQLKMAKKKASEQHTTLISPACYQHASNTARTSSCIV